MPKKLAELNETVQKSMTIVKQLGHFSKTNDIPRSAIET